MVSAAFRAVEQMFSPPFRIVLLKALGLTVLLFVVIGAAIQAVLAQFTISDLPYVDAMLAVIAGLGVIIGLVFLIGPITGLFAGVFLDEVAEAVEDKYYPSDPPGREMPILSSMGVALKFTTVLILVNIFVLLVSWVPVVNIVAFILGNGYLLGREYFEMVGMRHMPPEDAKALRKENASRVLMAGMFLAALVMVPFANLLVPLFATAFMVHIFKTIHAPAGGRLIEVH